MYKELFDLHGKVAVVIGGAGGIGSACALGVAEFGANVVIVDIDLETAERVKSQIEKIGVSAMAIRADVSKYEEVEHMVKNVLNEYGKIDIMINSAGINIRKSVVDLSLEEWNNVLNTNLTAAFIMSKVIGRELIKKRKGKVIHIVSTGGIKASANYSAYGASKAGLIQLVKTLALEWAPYNINVNAIAPTATETNFTAQYYAQNPEAKENAIKNHPFGRLGQPKDYVGAAIYLASRASDFVNGEIIVVDSGKTIK